MLHTSTCFAVDTIQCYKKQPPQLVADVVSVVFLYAGSSE